MYNFREHHDLQTKFASLARKIKALELKKSGQLKSVQEIICQIYETNEHSTNDCPPLPSFKECLQEHANALTVSKGQLRIHTHKHITLVREITQISVGRVVTIMHKLHSHHFKHTIISKILMICTSLCSPS
jgi:hypothetical protein